MKRLFESFRRYALLTEEQLLVEGRKDDAKKKYPQLVEAGLLDILIDADPSGNQKYLMWAAKMLNWEIENGYNPRAELFKPEARSLASNLQEYHKLQPYIRGEDKQFKDINNIKSFNDLISLVQRLDYIKNEIEQQKELKQKEKEEAMQSSHILINDDDFMMVRPTSAEASCYWGKGTKWCISATEAENYFAQYTNQGKSFYFLFSKHKDNFPADDWETYKKLALVFLNDGTFEEAYDASDQNMDEAEVKQIVAVNLLGSQVSDAYQEYTRYYDMEKLKAEAPTAYTILIDRMKADGLTPKDDVDDWWSNEVDNMWYEIEDSAKQFTQENPAGASEADFQEIIENANLQHIDVTVDAYDVDAWSWYASVAFDFESLEWGDKALDEYALEDLIHAVLDNNYIYAEEVEVYQNQVSVSFSTEDSGDGESDIDRFDSFVSGLIDADRRYEETHEELIEMFIEADALDISTSPYGQLRSKAKTQEYEHFEVDTSEGSVSYYVRMVLKIPEIGEVIRSLTRGLTSRSTETGRPDIESDYAHALANLITEFGRMFKPIGVTEFTFATNMLLDALSKHFLEAQNQAMQQLNLPGIPAAEIRQLITPSKFKIRWATLNTADWHVETLLGIALRRDDEPAQMKALDAFIEHFDKNYDDFEQIVRSVMIKALWSAAEEVATKMRPESNQAFSNMRPQTEQSAALAENRKRKRIRIIIQR